MNQDVAWRTETERKQSGGYLHAVWSGAGPGPSQLGWNRWSGEAERSIAPSGSTGSSGRWSRWSLGPPWWMRALAVAWQELTVRTAKSSMSVSSVTGGWKEAIRYS